jgi:metal-dependent amidase/aminoacylase/carboxypeptidase family protein
MKYCRPNESRDSIKTANGEGPTVMLRADMDALPIAENTGLAYASKISAKDAHFCLTRS